jgi:hypothetical protein
MVSAMMVKSKVVVEILLIQIAYNRVAISFKEAQKKVADIIKDRILVGHAGYNDLKALMLDHPRILIRDTSRYKPFRKHSKGRTPGLKLLVKEVLSISIQSGSHSSVSLCPSIDQTALVFG